MSDWHEANFRHLQCHRPHFVSGIASWIRSQRQRKCMDVQLDRSRRRQRSSMVREAPRRVRPMVERRSACLCFLSMAVDVLPRQWRSEESSTSHWSIKAVLPADLNSSRERPCAVLVQGPSPTAIGGAVSHVCNLTTDANELVADIHDRMTVILSRYDYALWLGPSKWRQMLRRELPAVKAGDPHLPIARP
jgi:hypothetical protein